jgi:hypothetical protein
MVEKICNRDLGSRISPYNSLIFDVSLNGPVRGQRDRRAVRKRAPVGRDLRAHHPAPRSPGADRRRTGAALPDRFDNEDTRQLPQKFRGLCRSAHLLIQFAARGSNARAMRQAQERQQESAQ